MIETIFRVIVILMLVAVVIAVIATLGITFNLPFQYSTLLLSFLHVVCYILPFGKLMPIFITVISVVVFKISVSLLKTIWQLLPIKG
jgi:hypothetical protein